MRLAPKVKFGIFRQAPRGQASLRSRCGFCIVLLATFQGFCVDSSENG